MRYKLLSLTNIILITNICFSLLLLLIYLAAIISPQHFWPLAFIGLAYPIILAINLLYVIFWLFKLRHYASISGLSIVVGFGLFFNYFGISFSLNKDIENKTTSILRMMAYNVHSFSSVDKPSDHSFQRILNLIKLKNPDIITFEEFCVRNSDFRFCDSLQKILGSKYFYFEPFLKTPTDSTGLAIFSRFPITNHQILRLSNENNDNQGIYVDVKSKFGVYRIYCLHLQSVQISPLDMLLLKRRSIFDADSKMRVITKLKNAYIKRGRQAELIKNQTLKCPYPYIIAGDFNDTPNSYTLHTIAAGLVNTFQKKGSGFGFTFDTRMPVFQIDYILTSQQFKTLNYQTVKEKMSDHYPIYADLTLIK